MVLPEFETFIYLYPSIKNSQDEDSISKVLRVSPNFTSFYYSLRYLHDKGKEMEE